MRSYEKQLERRIEQLEAIIERDAATMAKCDEVIRLSNMTKKRMNEHCRWNEEQLKVVEEEWGSDSRRGLKNKNYWKGKVKGLEVAQNCLQTLYDFIEEEK